MNEKMSRWTDEQRDNWSIAEGWSYQNHSKTLPPSPKKTNSFITLGGSQTLPASLSHACTGQALGKMNSEVVLHPARWKQRLASC